MKKIIVFIGLVLLMTGCSIDFNVKIGPTQDDTYFEDVVKCTIANVNMGKHIMFYEEGVLALVPITNVNGCTPDFTDEAYDYAFVGIIYDNMVGAYHYYLYVRDNGGNGYDALEYNAVNTISMGSINENETLKALYSDRSKLREVQDFDYVVYDNYKTRVYGYNQYKNFEKTTS